jgi:hypothetical protein
MTTAPLTGPLVEGRADVVYGSRLLGGPHGVLLLRHYFGNILFTLLATVLYDINLSDMCTCYKAFVRTVLEAAPLRSERFDIEAKLTAKFCKKHLRIYEVPVSTAAAPRGRKENHQEGRLLSPRRAAALRGLRLTWPDAARVWRICKIY